ncbi:MAG: hypothetical protein CMF48_04385 [Legionellales bacterium]|nr:hypothetical protein [Legionellales bacterium]|tara:strand:+ start:1816 stop:1995 length:180 start_codon:yes stop_codon:yes gene_type:complete
MKGLKADVLEVEFVTFTDKEHLEIYDINGFSVDYDVLPSIRGFEKRVLLKVVLVSQFLY